MHGPSRAFDRIADPCGLDVHSRQPEDARLGRLQIIPDRLAVVAKEFVPGNFHGHGSRVHEAVAGAIGADRPDAIYLIPRAFVTIQNQRWVGGRALVVIEIVGHGHETADRAGFNVHGKKFQHSPPRPPLRPCGGALLAGGGEAGGGGTWVSPAVALRRERAACR